MKIAYLCGDRGIPVGGRKAGSVHIQAIVEALRAQGHDVRIVATAGASTVDVVPMTVVETPVADQRREL